MNDKIPPEVSILVSKAKLREAAQQMCGHDWIFDHPSKLRYADPYVPGHIIGPFPHFNGSSVCRICGVRRQGCLER